MSPGGGWNDAVEENLRAGFYNHSFNLISKECPAFWIWEGREGITAEQFQEFIDGPKGPDFGLGAMMNICKEICLSLTETIEGQPAFDWWTDWFQKGDPLSSYYYL